MKKRKVGSIKRYVMAGIIVLLMAVCLIKASIDQGKKSTYSEKYVTMQELPSQMSFTYYQETEWKNIIEEINNGRNLNGKLTYGKLESLLEKLSLEEYVTYEKKAAFQKVSRETWNDIYEQMLDLLDVNQTVMVKDFVFLEEIKEHQILTQEGYYQLPEGISYFNPYDTYQVYIKGNEIIGVKGISTQEITWQNVFVHKAEKEKAEVLYENKSISLNIDGLSETITDTICDIVWKDGKVSAVYKKEDLIQGKVLSFNENQIEISGYGTLEYEGKLKIYKTYGTVEQLDESKLVIGNLEADFVVAEKKVCGIILKQPAEIETIRVLLLNEASPYRENPVFVSEADCTVTIGQSQQVIPAGQVITPASMLAEGSSDYVKITPNTEQARVYFSDEAGGKTSLGYRGSIEVRRYSEGFGVVNEVSLEQYLYGVVPSEMPATYEIEALRAQAVCARSYACIQLMRGDYASFAANIDDSTNYQVYNKKAEDENANLAVDDTVGEVIKYGDEIAEAYYFSTSCGHTDNMTVWNVVAEEKDGYINGTTLLSDGSEPDFSSEESFAAFIKDKDIVAYDSDSPYFRWRAELDMAGCLESVNQAVVERIQINPGNMQILKADGSEATVNDIAGFGAITGISVIERSSGGCLKKLQISYEHGSVQVLSEYNVRYILGKSVKKLTNKEGEEVSMALLPSAYCTIIPVENGYVVYGGGYGHGIGMSQNGANGMAKAGMSYIDILMKFYKGITIENIY